MAPITSFDRDAIKKSAAEIGSLMDGHRDALLVFADQWPSIGDVPAAQPLEQTVTARRAAVVALATRLDTAFLDMKATLTAIADDLAGTDQANATAVSDLAAPKTSVAKDLSAGGAGVPQTP